MGFDISNINIAGSVILFPNQFFMWDVASVEDIRLHHFDLIEFIKPKPSSVLSLTVKATS